MARLKPRHSHAFPLSNNFPSGRVVSEDTGDGGGGLISSPIRQPPPPLHPPLGLLPLQRRNRSREFLAPTAGRWGELLAASSSVP